MKKLWIFILAIVCLAIVMKMTVPSTEKHQEVATEQITVFVEDQMKNNPEVNDYLEEYGIDKEEAIKLLSESGIYRSLVQSLVETNLFFEDYFVCNIGKFEYDGEIYPLTVGVFNHVFVLTDYIDEIQAASEKMEQYKDKF